MREILRGQHGIRFAKLTEEQCTKLHEAVLQLLWDPGVELNHPRARALLAEAGADVAESAARVRIPRQLVEWALSVAPNTMVLHDRAGQPAMPAGEDRVFFGCGSETPFILDHRTWERRHGRLQDVVEGARVIDALPHFDFLMSLFLPWDLAPGEAYLRQYAAMLVNSTKPMALVVPDPVDLRAMIEMQEIIVGGAAERQARPRAFAYINVTNPFKHEHDELEKLILCAESDMPLAYVAPVLAGVSGPVRAPGCTVMALTGELVGVVIAQLVREGTAVAISGGITGVMDMKSMVTSYAAPEDRIISGEMARFYKLPHFGLGGSTDAKVVDAQSGAEAALTLFCEALVGSNIIHDVGYMESGGFNCLAQLTICNELIGWVRSAMAPLAIDENTLPMELIREQGIGGDFVSTDHTLEHFGELWYPGLFDRRKFDRWSAAGSTEMRAVAAEYVERILSETPAASPSDEVTEALEHLVSESVARKDSGAVPGGI